MEPEWIIRSYNQRGTAEQYIKEGKYAINWTRLSCRRFRDNEVRLQLHALAYNLGSFLKRADLPEEIADWSLTSIQSRLIKIGAQVVRHARKITFQLAEARLYRAASSTKSSPPSAPLSPRRGLHDSPNNETKTKVAR